MLDFSGSIWYFLSNSILYEGVASVYRVADQQSRFFNLVCRQLRDLCMSGFQHASPLTVAWHSWRMFRLIFLKEKE